MVAAAGGVSIADVKQVTVSIPESLWSSAAARAVEHGFDGAGDYLVDLIRRDARKADGLRALQSAIDDGRASPAGDDTVEDIIAAARHRRRAA